MFDSFKLIKQFILQSRIAPLSMVKVFFLSSFLTFFKKNPLNSINQHFTSSKKKKKLTIKNCYSLCLLINQLVVEKKFD